ncbi:MAG: hypothetical protein AAGH99_00840 [Planctomycetota bacterium]
MRIQVLCLLVCLGLSGCITALPPKVEVVSAEVTEVSEQGVRLEVALALSNPNEIAVPLPEASYTVSVQGTNDYAYVDLPARVLGPKGQQTIRLPAAFETNGEDVKGRIWDITGSVTYDPKNFLRSFLTQSGVPLPLVLFSGKGVLE